MLKIFLVEDESIMREGLRDNMPWQQFGYEFVGVMDGSLLDDILFFMGLFFFLDNVFREIVGFFRRYIQSGSVVFISAATATISGEMGEVHLSVGRSVFLHVIFMVSGILLLYLFLVRRYKRRSGVVS